MVKLNRRQSSAGKTAAGTVAARSKAPASAKVAAKRPNVKRRKQPDEPPVDRPDQRHRQLIQDRRFGCDDKNLAQLRLDALGEKAAAVSRRSGAIVSPVSLGADNWVQLGPTVIPNGQWRRLSEQRRPRQCHGTRHGNRRRPDIALDDLPWRPRAAASGRPSTGE